VAHDQSWNGLCTDSKYTGRVWTEPVVDPVLVVPVVADLVVLVVPVVADLVVLVVPVVADLVVLVVPVVADLVVLVVPVVADLVVLVVVPVVADLVVLVVAVVAVADEVVEEEEQSGNCTVPEITTPLVSEGMLSITESPVEATTLTPRGKARG